MTLTDPTDAELNYAFAEYVAGIERITFEIDDAKRVRPLYITKGAAWEGGQTIRPLPNYCSDHNAILPWLDTAGAIRWNSYKKSDGDYIVGLEGPCSVGEIRFEGTAPTLGKAAVIALLRWHGADVRFPS